MTLGAIKNTPLAITNRSILLRLQILGGSIFPGYLLFSTIQKCRKRQINHLKLHVLALGHVANTRLNSSFSCAAIKEVSKKLPHVHGLLSENITTPACATLLAKPHK
jgi:hypothetical protein